MKIRRADVLLPAAVLLAAALVWLGLYLGRSPGAVVRITADGELYGEYPLNEPAEIRIDRGEDYNILVIDGKTAEMLQADCPDKLCVKQGKIQYDGQSIICLPHKLTVEILGGKAGETNVVAK